MSETPWSARFRARVWFVRAAGGIGIAMAALLLGLMLARWTVGSGLDPDQTDQPDVAALISNSDDGAGAAAERDRASASPYAQPVCTGCGPTLADRKMARDAYAESGAMDTAAPMAPLTVDQLARDVDPFNDDPVEQAGR